MSPLRTCCFPGGGCHPSFVGRHKSRQKCITLWLAPQQVLLNPANAFFLFGGRSVHLGAGFRSRQPCCNRCPTHTAASEDSALTVLARPLVPWCALITVRSTSSSRKLVSFEHSSYLCACVCGGRSLHVVCICIISCRLVAPFSEKVTAYYTAGAQTCRRSSGVNGFTCAFYNYLWRLLFETDVD